MRHAKSSWDSPGLADHDRPLNPRGRRGAAAMRGVLHDLGLAPDLILVSSATRTLQTLAALEPWDGTPEVRRLDALYLASAAQLLTQLRLLPDNAGCVLLIGHNPGLHDLAVALVGKASMNPANELTRRLALGYPTGALAEFAVAGPWHALDEGAGRLQRFVGPRDLPESTP